MSDVGDDIFRSIVKGCLIIWIIAIAVVTIGYLLIDNLKP